MGSGRTGQRPTHASATRVTVSRRHRSSETSRIAQSARAGTPSAARAGHRRQGHARPLGCSPSRIRPPMRPPRSASVPRAALGIHLVACVRCLGSYSSEIAPHVCVRALMTSCGWREVTAAIDESWSGCDWRESVCLLPQRAATTHKQAHPRGAPHGRRQTEIPITTPAYPGQAPHAMLDPDTSCKVALHDVRAS